MNLYKRIFFIIVSLAVAGFAHSADAAVLKVSPGSGSFAKGTTFTVGVYVESSDKAINAISGTLIFPIGDLQVVSISKQGSIANLWVQEPAYSNFDGTVDFEGVVLNPGYQGALGKIISVTFRVGSGVGVKSSTSVSFRAGSVLANDGEGTNVLSNLLGGTYTLTNAPIPSPSKDPITSTAGTIRPVVTSRTHPDENKWYNARTVDLAWDLPKGVDGVAYTFDANPRSIPPSDSKGILSSVSYNLDRYDEGLWYFHSKFHTSAGWGETTHRLVKSDVTAPTHVFVRRVETDTDPTNPTPIFEAEASDTLSGVQAFGFVVGNQAEARLDFSTTHQYTLPVQEPGDYPIILRAYDAAGNSSEATTSVHIDPIATPRINEFSDAIRSPKEAFQAAGEAIPNSTVELTLRNGTDIITFSTLATREGYWNARYDERIDQGSWSLTVRARDARGALSNPTQPLQVIVRGWLLDTIHKIVEVGIGVALIILFIGFLIVLSYRFYRAIVVERARLRRDLMELDHTLQEDVAKLKVDFDRIAQSKEVIDPNLVAAWKLKEDALHLEKSVQEELAKLKEPINEKEVYNETDTPQT